MKRNRVNGHVSKEAYEEGSGSSSSGFGIRANETELAGRRMVSVSTKKSKKKEEFAKHIQSLHKGFYDWVKTQSSSSSSKHASKSNLKMGVQDCINYSTELEDRYLRTYGEVLTFGSGDCGQLAHGMEEDDDLMVKFPRVVMDLRNKKVVGISCGGLHNAVYTETGQVYTWGCNDDLSLGRALPKELENGEDADASEAYWNNPYLVSGKDDELITGNVVFVGVSCGDAHTMAITAEGEVWGWGCYKDKEGKQWFDADYEKCGRQDKKALQKDIKKAQVLPLKIDFFSQDSQGSSSINTINKHDDRKVVSLCSGTCYNVARCSSGQLYSWGVSECGELARPTKPMKVNANDPEDPELEVYDHEEIFKTLMTPGYMYQTESSLVVPMQKNDVRQRHTAPDGTKLVQVRDVQSAGCGAYHTMVIKDSDVYSCGLNNYGQLGHGDEENRDFFEPVEALAGLGVAQACGGIHHSLVVTGQGRLLGFGRGDSGQLGVKSIAESEAGAFSNVPVGPDTAKGSEPVENVHFVKVAAGTNHNLALTKENELYTWGYGDMLALGHGKEKDELAPRRVKFGTKNSAVVTTMTQVDGGGQHSAIIGTVTAI